MSSERQRRREGLTPSRRQVLRGSLLGAAGLTAAPALNACGGDDNDSETTGSDGRAMVRLWHWYTQQTDQWPRLVEEFEESHPNIQVENRQFGDADSYLPALQSAVAADDPPEIFGPHVLAIEYGRAGIAADLRAELGDEFLSQFFPSTINHYAEDDQNYGVGWMAQTFGIFYQPKHFDAAGVDVPETWDDLITVAQAIREEVGIEPVALPNNTPNVGADFFLPLITQVTDDPQLVLDLDFQRNGARWDGPPVIEALEMVQRLVDEGVFAANPNGIAQDQGRQMLYTDRAAMQFTGSFTAQEYVQEAPEEFVESFRVMKTPAWAPGARHWTGNQAGAGFSVSETSPNKEAALEFLQFMYEPERYSTIMNESNSMPSTEKAATTIENPVMEEMTSWLIDGDGAPHILFGPGSFDAVSNAVAGLIGGELSPEDAAADIQANVERAAERG